MDNVFTREFDNRSIHSNINSILLKLMNKNLLFRTCLRWKRQMRVQHPLT